jgi:hypothetical protein
VLVRKVKLEARYVDPLLWKWRGLGDYSSSKVWHLQILESNPLLAATEVRREEAKPNGHAVVANEERS